MHIRPFRPDDSAVVAQVLALGEAIDAADSPWQPRQTLAGLTHHLRHGWDGEPPRPFAAHLDGQLVAAGELSTSEYDNLGLAWLGVGVHPGWRRRGLGSLLLERLCAEARTLGRTTVGIDGWDLPRSRAFAAHHGFVAKSVEVQRRQYLADLDGAGWERIDRLHAEAGARAGDYELLRLAGRTPERMLPALAELVAAINDAPTDELDVEDEKFPVERVRDYESAQVGSGRLYRVLARHRPTGRLAGHTVVQVEDARRHLGWQHDTSVAAAHRGHRLGLLLKADMLRWLRDAEPQIDYVETWNARSNHHMIAVNETLGYRVTGTTVDYQRRLENARAATPRARVVVDA